MTETIRTYDKITDGSQFMFLLNEFYDNNVTNHIEELL